VKKLFYLALAAVFGFVGYKVFSTQNRVDQLFQNEIKAFVVYNNLEHNNSYILDAYRSVLEEEGVSFAFIPNDKLIKMDVAKVSKVVPAIIFPEFVNEHLLSGTEYWIADYVKDGGHIALVHDADSKDQNGRFITENSFLGRRIGVDLAAYERARGKSFGPRHVRFTNAENVDFFDFPPSRVDDTYTITGYQYGRYEYPTLDIDFTKSSDQKVYAVSDDAKAVFVERNFYKGSIVYANPPLGLLKGRSDDLILRSFLKTFLFKMVKMPHIVSAPNAKGTLILNWHVDSAVEFTSLPWNIAHGYIGQYDFNQSFHITAGPDLDRVGDHQGFDAARKGYMFVKMLMEYGTIGSHGGWNHNWFSDNIDSGKFGKKEMKKYIKLNNDTLEKIVGYKPTEYSAPNGNFPPHESIEIMKELGFGSFYYTGDTGSVPNRTFYDGKMLSKDIIAFPVMSFDDVVSLREFHDIKEKEPAVENYLLGFVDHLVRSRTVKLFYSHPYDIRDYEYKNAMRSYLNYVKKLVAENRLQTRTLTDERNFLLRLIDTKQRFELLENGITVSVENNTTLSEQVLALPKMIGGKEIVPERKYEEDENYYYIPLDPGTSRTAFFVRFK